jgi:hypothetical protein
VQTLLHDDAQPLFELVGLNTGWATLEMATNHPGAVPIDLLVEVAVDLVEGVVAIAQSCLSG